MLSLRYFLIINAFLALSFGLSFLFFPQEFVSIYGLTLTPDGYIFARSLGGALLAIASMAFLGRDTKDKHALLGILIGGALIHSVNGFTDYIAVTDGVMNASGYSIVVLHFFCALGFFYYLFANPAKHK